MSRQSYTKVAAVDAVEHDKRSKIMAFKRNILGLTQGASNDGTKSEKPKQVSTDSKKRKVSTQFMNL